jgi:hypothetical protein
MLLVYVDDITAAAKLKIQLQHFFETLSARFNAKNLGKIKKILGTRVTRNRKNRKLYLDQKQYLMTVLNRFGIIAEKHKSKKIPTDDFELLHPTDEKDERINVSEYQQGIGSLLYVMVFIHPDIAFVLGKLSQFMSDPAKYHGYVLKNLLRYIKSTIKQKLRFGSGGAYDHMVVYSDADWASDKLD